MLVRFDKQGDHTPPDFLERVGNITFDYFLSGKRYTVETFLTRNKFSFCSESIRYQYLTVLLSIFTLPARLVGVVAYHFSSTYQETYKDFVIQSEAALRIQQLWQKQQLCKQHLAATKIQKLIRGFLTRKAFINCDLRHKGHSICQMYGTPDWDHDCTCISTETKVYLPRRVPQLVLKYFGTRKIHCKERALRVQTMLSVRKLLSEIGSRYLVLPKICGYQGFLIEERLPVSSDSAVNLWTYQSNPSAFDAAVVEMVRLSRYVTFHGLESIGDSLHNQIFGTTKVIRYDKIPCFIEIKQPGDELEKRVGKIGLIHLEDVEIKPQEHSVELLTYIFPYHSRLICDEARRLGISFSERKRKKAEIAGRKFIHTMFIRHRKWLRARGVSIDKNVFVPVELTTAEFCDLSTHLAEKLGEYLARHTTTCGCFGNKDIVPGISSETILRIGEDVARLLLQRYREEMEHYHEGASRRVCTTELELLIMRAPVFAKEQFWKDGLDIYYLKKMEANEFKLQKENAPPKSMSEACTALSSETLDWFLDWLVQEDHILHYTSSSKTQRLQNSELWLQY